MDDLAFRVRAIEDREAIRDLAIAYCFAVDDRQFDKLRTMFTSDAVLETAQGAIKGQGLDEVVGYYTAHLPTLGPSNHFVHGHQIDLDPYDSDRASGLVSAHAELWRNEKPMLAALRYDDVYLKVEGRWQFRRRTQSYMYFVDVREYPEALGSELRVQVREGRSAPADWPKIYVD